MNGIVLDLNSTCAVINLTNGRVVEMSLNNLPFNLKIGDKVNVDTCSHNALSSNKTMDLF